MEEIHEVAGKKGIETGYNVLQHKYHNELSVWQISKDYKEFEELYNERNYSDVIKYLTLTKAKNHYLESTK